MKIIRILAFMYLSYIFINYTKGEHSGELLIKLITNSGYTFGVISISYILEILLKSFKLQRKE
jgi:hypothetical protein